jgi:hypothetical protein
VETIVRGYDDSLKRYRVQGSRSLTAVDCEKPIAVEGNDNGPRSGNAVAGGSWDSDINTLAGFDFCFSAFSHIS